VGETNLAKETETEIFSAVLPTLESKFWLLTPANTCKPLSNTLFEIITQFAPKDSSYRIKAIQLATQYLVSSNDIVVSRQSASNLVMGTVSSIQAARLCLSPLDPSLNDSIQQLCFQLEHADYEVRLETLKYIRKTLVKKNKSIPLKLQEKLVSRTFIESHYECLRKVFQLIRELEISLPQSIAQDTSKLKNLWNKVNQLLNSSAKAEAIAFMGYFFQVWCNEKHQDAEFSKQMCSKWVEVIKEHSSPDQMLDFRDAAAKSVYKGIVVKEVSHLSSYEKEAIVNGWLICIKLLQDEDDDLRWEVAGFVSFVLPKQRPLKLIYKASQAQEFIFDYLNDNYSHSETYFHYLLHNLNKEEKLDKDDPDQQKLFEKEEDNNFEEEVTLIQLSCFYTQSLIAKKRENPLERESLDKLVETQRKIAIEKLQKRVNELEKGELEDKVWGIFTTYKTDIFRYFYRPVIQLLTFSSKGKENELRELKILANGERTHPILKNVLDQVESIVKNGKADESSLFFLLLKGISR